MKKTAIPILLILIFIILVVSYSYFSDHLNPVNQTLYLLPSFLAVVLGALAVKKMGLKGRMPSSLFFIFLGILCWFLGELLWWVFELILSISPYPSVADLFYVLGYPLIFIGFAKLYRMQKINWTGKRIFLTGALLLILISVTVYFGVIQAYDPANGVWENAFAIFYGLGDVVLVAVIIIEMWLAFEYQGGEFFYAWFYFLIGMVLTVVADILYAIYYEDYIAGSGLARDIDFFWAGAFLLFGYASYKIRNVVVEVQNKIKKEIAPKSE